MDNTYSNNENNNTSTPPTPNGLENNGEMTNKNDYSQNPNVLRYDIPQWLHEQTKQLESSQPNIDIPHTDTSVINKPTTDTSEITSPTAPTPDIHEAETQTSPVIETVEQPVIEKTQVEPQPVEQTTPHYGKQYNTQAIPETQPTNRKTSVYIDNQPYSYTPKKKQPSRVGSILLGIITGLFLATLIMVPFLSNKINIPNQNTKTPEAITETKKTEDTPALTINESPIANDTSVQVAQKTLPSVVSVYSENNMTAGMGSGVILDKLGHILTNYHVVEDAKTVYIVINNEKYDTEVIGSDPSSDLAVLQIEDVSNLDLTAIEIGDSDALVPGQWVMTVGSPFGLDQSVSVGIVSSLARSEIMQSTYGNTIYANLIQTDAVINPGNSGGALVNERGQLVGINTLFSSDSESYAGVGFAIPSNYAIEIANTIIRGEDITHAYIGLSMQTINEYNAKRINLNVNYGAYVAEVSANSPAEQAGIKTGDVIVGIDNDKIRSADDVLVSVRTHHIGDTVKVTFIRNNKEQTVDVTLTDDSALQQQQREMGAFDGQEPVRDYQIPDELNNQNNTNDINDINNVENLNNLDNINVEDLQQQLNGMSYDEIMEYIFNQFNNQR